MKKTLTLALVITAMTIAPALAAPPCGPHRGHGGPLMGPHALPVLAEALDLSEAQRQQIETIVEENAPELPAEDLRQQMQSLRQELHALWQAESPDRNAILAKMSEMDAVRDGLRDARRRQRVDVRLSVLEVLTPEQRGKWLELRQEMRSERPGRLGAGRGGRHGRKGDCLR
jgi:Spy/CpxP family protein refolding chaperone